MLLARGSGRRGYERLTATKEFQRAYNEGRRNVTPVLVCFVLQRASGPLRLGVVASRRVGGAVRRNRAKRLLREAFRRQRPKRVVSADVVLVARQPILDATLTEVEAAYRRSAGRLLEKIP